MLAGLLRPYVRPYRGLIALVAGFQLISTLALLYLPTVNASIIDDGVAKGDTHTIIRLGGLMLLVTGLQVLCAVGALYAGSRASIGFGRDLRSAMFHHVTGLSEQDTAPVGTPSLLTRTTNDVRQIEVVVQVTTTVLITVPIMCVGGVFMSIRQNAGLSWLLIVSVPVLAVASYLIISRMLPLFEKLQKLIDNINRVMREQLSGIRAIRAFARERFEQERFAKANREVFVTALAAGRWQVLMVPMTVLVIDLSSVALIWFGGLRIGAGRMQVGSLIAFLSYFLLILISVLMAMAFLELLPRASVCAGRISEVLSTTPAITSPRDRKRPAYGIEGIVRLDNVAFRYPGADHSALRNVSLTALPGTVTAIIGKSGSGKSTLVSLICRFYDVTAGAVLVDGIDVRDYDTDQLWSAIGLVPQRGHLFSGTVADNLRFGRPGASDAEVWEALRVAAADDFVREHPDGLQMQLSQGGVNLSGGQRQMLAIARAVINRPAVYLFDDAFSALDVHTDARVRTSLREVAPDSTMIVVAQRISTVAAVDQIVVLDHGEVIGIGTHESLLADCPAYAELSELQSLSSDAVGWR
ncbi:ABC transporter ATP-binding protein [Mycobacterium kiyosense]|uniref:ABC transporter ATP-binding protein n=1 Tax=Mycobacterium kiyosense TaxID=2871094 RepID=UPI00216E0A36|nr:ABC transporter ATP-binding protein [Mycobacterium kiyosense]GLB93004.1 putative ABC transporter ATP-binding protein [Mycobacterium kiyosense]GLC04122.1 putative ABC transporter ATP-binding protein [Mycobacterium kiyosense]GLC11192.1 putative ABC transporter ATP-binding protein [Mycobacterium kiyosense]GLC17178.1 putative ABC transporter ATP-binding protein [Mycobacterium kiyosense]GLC23465.1 putative ABC transporter ATP-binding protein [Mycobacterium kiyosense]